MLPKAFTIAAAGLAAATNAFLLPPSIPTDDAVKSDEPRFNILPFEIERTAEPQVIKVDCPGCPIVVAGQVGRFRMKHGSSHLELSFSVDHSIGYDRLLANDFELYPRSDPFASTLSAPVVPDFDSDDAPKSLAVAAQDLGFSLLVRPVKKDEDTNSELISIDLGIIEVGSVFVSSLNSIRVELIKAADGALVIAKIEQTPAQADKPSAACTTLVCKWKAMVNDYVNRIKPTMKHCAGKMGHHMAHGAHSHGPEAGRPQMHHNHHHSWALLFKKFNHTILFPILVGIVAGISVSIIGMVVGTLIVGTYRVFVRGQPFFRGRCPHRRRSGHAHKAAAQEAVYPEEKSGLIDSQDTLPPYEDEEPKKTDV